MKWLSWQIQGRFVLGVRTEVKTPDTKKNFSFLLTNGDPNTQLEMTADNEATKIEWISAIKKVFLS